MLIRPVGRCFAAVMCLLALLPTAARSGEVDPQAMAARVDELLQEEWEKQGVEPAPLASDSEFLRRAWLDLTGIIPPLNEPGKDGGNYGVRGFLADRRSDKRARLIQHLVSKPKHAGHFANLWRRIMLPADSNAVRFGRDQGFQTWLHTQFRNNVPYDQMVRAILLARGNANGQGPALYYTALQLKPEELAASTSKIFLGVQIECAQCHDHPFDHWKRTDFWGYAAYFAQLQRGRGNRQFQVVDTNRGEVKIPDTNQQVAPRFLGAKKDDQGKGNRRQRLAAWLTGPENPYFARATVNRVWSLLFGRGLVDPVDDLGEHNRPSHPRLMQELADYFVSSGFNLRQLISTLAQTRAYQRSSQSTAETETQPELFARMAIKSLSGEQLYDCLTEAMRRRASTVSGRTATFYRGDPTRQTFLEKFRAPEQGATELEWGIPQALTLMNGTLVRRAVSTQQSDLLTALQAPFFSDQQRVETLFLSTLSRPPSASEKKKFLAYVKRGGTTDDRRTALGDVLWALLNSPEFVLNH